MLLEKSYLKLLKSKVYKLYSVEKQIQRFTISQKTPLQDSVHKLVKIQSQVAALSSRKTEQEWKFSQL